MPETSDFENIRYWVGSYGNWNDTANWSTTPTGEGGASVPMRDDIVFFFGSAKVFDVYDYLEDWPEVVVWGDWTVVEFLVNLVVFDNSLLRAKVSVLENNLFRLVKGTPQNVQQVIHEIPGVRAPYVPLLSAIIGRFNVDQYSRQYILNIINSKAESIFVDWGDGRTDRRTYRLDTDPVSLESLIFHEYDSPGAYTVTVTAEAGEFALEYGEDENGDPLLASSDTQQQTIYIPERPIPVASLETSPHSGVAPLTVTASTSGSVGSSMTINWGDGSQAETIGATKSHEYEDAGEYLVTLTAFNEDGLSTTESRNVVASVFVPPPANPPQAVLSVTPWSGVAPLTVTASTSGSVGSSMTINWGDGSQAETIGATKSHEYEDAGEYLVTLTAFNEDGDYEESRWPVQSLAPFVPGDRPSIDAFSVLQSQNDPYGFDATWNVSGADSVLIDWGDGTDSGMIISGQFASHAYARTGIYTVRLTAANSAGQVSDTRTVEVTLVVTSTGATFSRCLKMEASVSSTRHGGMV